MKRSFLQVTVIGILVLLPAVASAQCQQLLKPHVDWLKKSPANYVRVVSVSNVATQLVRYSVADPVRLNPAGTKLVGQAEVFKSEKTYPTTYKTGLGTSTKPSPFDPKQTEQMALSVDIATGSTNIGSDTIASPQCSVMILYGFGKAGYVANYYVLSFTDKTEATPK